MIFKVLTGSYIVCCNEHSCVQAGQFGRHGD